MQRSILNTIRAVDTADGAGVKLKRSLGITQSARLDPFLLLDAFASYEPMDYIAGFPAHPHRGFETVTYLVEGHMRHRDHLGNEGDLKPGGVQWMRAGRGIIHEEMPQQEDGLLRGFQLWVNLPATEKMRPASYRDISDQEMPRATLSTGGMVKIIAGEITIGTDIYTAPVDSGSTELLYLDVKLQSNESITLPLPMGHNSLIYAFEGELNIEGNSIPADNLAILSDGDLLSLQANENGSRFLLLAGKPLAEPIVQYGPFVMNTQQEIEQALEDYRNGTLTA